MGQTSRIVELPPNPQQAKWKHQSRKQGVRKAAHQILPEPGLRFMDSQRRGLAQRPSEHQHLDRIGYRRWRGAPAVTGRNNGFLIAAIVLTEWEAADKIHAFVTGGGYKYCQLGEGNCFLPANVIGFKLDAEVDENCDGFDGVTCFEDLDGDGYLCLLKIGEPCYGGGCETGYCFNAVLPDGTRPAGICSCSPRIRVRCLPSFRTLHSTARGNVPSVLFFCQSLPSK